MLHCLVNVEHAYYEAQPQACPCEASIFLMAFYNPDCVFPPDLPTHIPSQPRISDKSTSSCEIVHDDAISAAVDPEQQPDHGTDRFLDRFTELRPRVEQLIRGHWRDEVDVFELDNLIQAGFIRLWLGYHRDPDTFLSCGDGYWYATAKRGARDEFIREFRQRHRQKGSGHAKPRQHVEVIFNAGDILASRYTNDDENDIDETILSHELVVSHDTKSYLEADCYIDVGRLITQIYRGTNPSDHPMISRILIWMREGLSLSQMADEAGVKTATIKCMVRRIRQACGAAQEAKANKRNGYGSSKDARILRLFHKGTTVPSIARLIGSNHKFVYQRLRALNVL